MSPITRSLYAIELSMKGLIRYSRNEDGTSAVEFALVILASPCHRHRSDRVCTVMYFNATMQHSVEDSARWASVTTTVNNGTAPSATAVQNHFNTRYVGPTVDNLHVRVHRNGGDLQRRSRNTDVSPGYMPRDLQPQCRARVDPVRYSGLRLLPLKPRRAGRVRHP